jgi:hypothetical protein
MQLLHSRQSHLPRADGDTRLTANAPHQQACAYASPFHRQIEGHTMSLGNILLIVIILMLLGAIPTWPHSAGWGYWPSGSLGLVLLIVVVLILTGRM